MKIERLNAGSCRPALQSSFVLDVKPAFEDVGCVYFSGFPIHVYMDMYSKQPNRVQQLFKRATLQTFLETEGV
jgi:hypothetical protein